MIAGVGDWVLGAGSDEGELPRNRELRTRPLRKTIRSWLLHRMARRSGNDPDALAAMRAAQRSGLDAQKLSEVRCPVLILVGRNDRGARPAAKLATAIPGAEIMTVPGGHLTAVVEPEFRRAIVDFLTWYSGQVPEVLSASRDQLVVVCVIRRRRQLGQHSLLF